MAGSTYQYVILGGGMAAGSAAQEFAQQAALKPGMLGIVSNEATLPYERPPLSKDFLTGKVEVNEIMMNDEALYREHGIDVRLSTTVTAVDFGEKSLRTDAGEVIRYEKLLIATGSSVRTLEIPGANLEGVFYLRTLTDAQAIRGQATTKAGGRAVVIGGGYIGLETSASLTKAGLTVTVVMAEDRLLPRLFTLEMSAFFQNYYEKRGVTFVPKARVVAITGDERASGVVLDSGQELPAGLVVAGIGVVPNVRLYENTGLHTDNGIVVNEYLETNVPDVYAAGDVSNYKDILFGKQRHVEHWDNAVEGGKHAARMLMGRREPFRHVPYFFSDEFDLSWEFWGDTEGADSIIHRGDLEGAKFSVWWLRGKRLVAAFVMDRPDDERDAAQRWIETGQDVDADLLKDADRPLQSAA